MSWRPLGLGAGIGAFLLVTLALTELLVDLSAVVAAPVGLVVAALTIMFAYRWTRADASDAAVRTVAGAAAFGYVALALYLVQDLSGALDSLLTPLERVLYAGLAAGALAAALAPPERVRGTD